MECKVGAASRRVSGVASGVVLASIVSALTAWLPAWGAEVVGYYPGWKSEHFSVTAANIDTEQMSMVLYAFLDVCWDGRHGNPDASVNDVAACQDAGAAAAGTAVPANGTLVFRDSLVDSANLRALVALKKNHPKLRVVVSVGGWNWSNQFSNLADSAAARKVFAASSIQLMRRFGLDGVDIDWEYPGGAGIPCAVGQICDRPTDKQNFVTLARELRQAFDLAGMADGKHYGITIAAGGNANYLDGVVEGKPWIKPLSDSLDWINLMAYDYHMPWEASSGHHAALLDDPQDPVSAQGLYADAAVRRYLRAGVGPDRLVLGVPFYGYGWKDCPPGPQGGGQYQPCGGAAGGGNDGTNSYSYAHLLQQGYLTGADTDVGGKGYTRYWNAAARVPYLYSAAKRIWISYEDPVSLREKRRYIRAQGLRGVMFWELSADSEHRLLRALTAPSP